ncbi:NAD(P)/FAD-dependent oxidoreductase [Lunatibacter salilacus]|uniref:NAD(P)/FAD-dependent oxidoreductase n=1 Tax=Lunatibacter salilacus TaxID=2483804 RepID=UPI001F2A727B|nr:NAD(P)/FAD-dependent oxidoreductase [Lunatibacter salilacus]
MVEKETRNFSNEITEDFMHQVEIAIIGGGLSGLVAAYLLAKSGRDVLLVEKKSYPFHRVCGEYISNEVSAFLVEEGLFPTALGPSTLTRFRLSSINGRVAEMPLDLGGFGISRFGFDHFLYEKCKAMGVNFLLNTQVSDVVEPKESLFELSLDTGSTVTASFVLGAFGKRSKIDKALKRPFFAKRSPFIGVKYHVRTLHEPDMVALHNFEGGYCGINKVEDDIFNICYLANRHLLKKHGSIAAMETEALFKNPQLAKLFNESEFLWEKPEVINEINFCTKKPVENNILMLGDAAGMITPLCGNGMAIAIHTGKLAAEAILAHNSLKKIQTAYASSWESYFEKRLYIGRMVQRLFGSAAQSDFAVGLVNQFPYLARQIMRRTHGEKIN